MSNKHMTANDNQARPENTRRAPVLQRCLLCLTVARHVAQQASPSRQARKGMSHGPHKYNLDPAKSKSNMSGSKIGQAQPE